jgi:RHS repeat-associated protein
MHRSISNNFTTHTRYLFQAQEMDDEIKGEGNSVNYKYRMHDPRLGRFFSADPLASKYPHNGTYNFSENRVIDGVELEGLEVQIVIGNIPTGTTEIRIIGSENIKDCPKFATVPTYPLFITDPATNRTTVHNVTRDALYINRNSKPDSDGNFTLFNIPFEPKMGSSNKYEGEERSTFGETELPAIRLRQNASIKLPAEKVNSKWRKNPDIAESINIHVGGSYTTSKNQPGEVNVTGSEGCITVTGGNSGISNLINEINQRQEKLKASKLPTNIEIEVDRLGSDFNKNIKIESTQKKGE